MSSVLDDEAEPSLDSDELPDSPDVVEDEEVDVDEVDPELVEDEDEPLEKLELLLEKLELLVSSSGAITTTLNLNCSETLFASSIIL